MASAERPRYRHLSEGAWENAGDQLTPIERDDLLEALADVYPTAMAAERLLDRIGMPAGRRPGLWTEPVQAWQQIFTNLRHGLIRQPAMLRLVEAGLRAYPHHPVFTELAIRYGILVPEDNAQEASADAPPGETDEAEAPEPPAGTATNGEMCHLIVRISGPQALRDAQEQLESGGLAPTQEWVTRDAVSFRLNTDRSDEVLALIDELDLHAIVVPPGAPDYLIRRLIVLGPDSSPFELFDTPAQETVGELAGSVMDKYHEITGDGALIPPRNTVVDIIEEDGAHRRAQLDDTLDAAGVTEDSVMQVAEDVTAGVNPVHRGDHLVRVRNEVTDFVERHPAMGRLQANSDLEPTLYILHFTSPTFRPGTAPASPPVFVPGAGHAVRMVLGPEFPAAAPLLQWETPIFHPNVFPTYDCKLLREQGQNRGRVCIGALDHMFVPQLHFGIVCQLLLDIAGYRNYSVERIEDGKKVPDAIDPYAAAWVRTPEAQAAVAKMHGMRLERSVQRRRWPNLIERMSG